MEDVGEPLVDESFGHGRFVSCLVALSVELFKSTKTTNTVFPAFLLCKPPCS